MITMTDLGLRPWIREDRLKFLTLQLSGNMHLPGVRKHYTKHS